MKHVFAIGILISTLGANGATFVTDFSSATVPPGSAVSGSAVISASGGIGNSGVLRLTEAANSQNGMWTISDFSGGLPVYGINATFKMELGASGTSLPADGLSFNWATNLTQPFAEEGSGTGLTVSFDTFDNGGGEAPAIDIKWGGNTIAHSAVPFDFSAANNAFVPVQIILTNGTVTVIFNGTVVHSNIGIPGFTPLAGGQFGFGARTGAYNERHYIDNVSITTSTLQPPAFITSGSFFTGSSVGGLSEPIYITAADVNNDGWTDLITSDYQANQLTVLTNNHAGGFAIASTPAVGSIADWVAAVDVNGDGWVDLVSANGGGNNLTVLTNDHTGNFVISSSPNVGSGPICVAAADLNGDGKPDLITANSAGSSLTVLINNGSGGFIFWSTLAVASNPFFVTTADVNGDGTPDIICSDSANNELTILTNDGSAGFVISSEPAVGSDPYGIATADVNGDGKVDLIAADATGSSLTVLTNDGSGGFAVSSSPGAAYGARSVTAVDVNSDGKIDLLSSDPLNNNLQVLLNDGNGGFNSAGSVPTGSTPYNFVAADLNHDALIDLAVANFNGSSVSALLGTNQNNFVTMVAGTSNSIVVRTAGNPLPFLSESGALPSGLHFTANGDGTATLYGTPALGTGGTNQITITATNTLGTVTEPFVIFIEEMPVVTSTNVATFTTGVAGNFSVTATGVPQPFINQYSTLPNGLTFQSGTGTATISGTPGPGTAGTYEFTLYAGSAAGGISTNLTLIINQPASFTGGVSFGSQTNIPLDGGPNAVVAQDFNGDGKPDLAVATTNNTVMVLTNDGQGGFELCSAPTVGPNPNFLAAVDLNSNGKLELVTANFDTNTLTLLTNDGTGNFSVSATLVVGSEPSSVAAGDINGDHKIDLICSDYNSTDVIVLTNDGNGGFILSSSNSIPFPAPLTSVTAIDGNDDGYLDLIAGGWEAEFGFVNDGTGNFSSFPLFSAGEFLLTADVNNDGFADLISADIVHNQIVISTNDPASGGIGFGPTNSVGSGPVWIASGDINGDGKLDLVTADQFGNTLTILTNDGAANFDIALQPGTGHQPDSVAVADFNGDGKPDLVSANYGDNSLTIWYNSSLYDHAKFFQGQPGSFSVSATGYPPPALTETGALPPGLHFTDNDDGAASILGTPTASGIFNVTVTAANSTGTNSFNLTLTVVPPPFLNISQSGPSVVVSWSTLLSDYKLQTSATLPTNWQNYLLPIPTNGANFVLTNTPTVTNPAAFFRLKH